jgi:hypothetical protein
MNIINIFLFTLLSFVFSNGNIEPFIARITYKISENDFERVGSIISERFILTTDSTGVEHSIFVHVGATNSQTQTKISAMFWLRITSLHESPGLIQLSKPLIFSSNIRAIHLPPENEVLDLPNIEGLVINQKKSLFTRITNHTFCSKNYPNHPNFSFFCGIRNQNETCINDRGVGFATISRGREYLIGIAIENSCNSRPFLFIRLSFYRQRILNLIKESFDNLKDY